MSAYDVVVLGSEPNGLAAAIAAARAGRRTLVLEEGPVVGGVWGSAEFHPGYRHVGAVPGGTVRPAVASALELDVVLRDRPEIVVAGDPALRVGRGGAWRAPIDAARAALGALHDAPAPPLPIHGSGRPLWPFLRTLALARRAMSRQGVLDLMRILPDSAESWLSEHVSDPRHRAAIAMGPLFGAFHGPMSPQSAGLLVLYEALTDRCVSGDLAGPFERAARRAGVELRTGVPIEAIEVSGGAVIAVRAGGERIGAAAVISALDPRRTVLGLLAGVSPALDEEVATIRTRATHATLHLAVSGPVKVRGADGPVEHFRVVRDVVHLERAFDDAKHGRLPADPPLDVTIPSVARPELALAGGAVLTVQVFGAPGGAWTDDGRQVLLARALAALDGALQQPLEVVGHELWVSADLERRYGLTGGHVMHGEHALDRWWIGRPGMRTSGHRTPIRGVYLGSSGIHPGGWSAGASGWFAARALLEAR